MTAALTPVPKIQFFANDGTPLVGGKLYTYAAGTTTPLATYVSYAGTTANTNPVILDSRGEADVWLGNALYKLALYDADNALIWTVDNITTSGNSLQAELAASGGSALIGYLAAGAGAVATTVQTKLRETISVKDFGAKGDNSTDDTAAIQAAIDSLSAKGGVVFFPAGYYKISNTLLVKYSNIGLRGDGIVASTIVNTSSSLSAIRFAASPDSSIIYGNSLSDIRVTVPAALDSDAIGVELTHCDSFTMSSVSVKEYLINLKVSGARGLFVSNCLFASGSYFAATPKSGSRSVMIQAYSISDTSFNFHFTDCEIGGLRNTTTNLPRNEYALLLDSCDTGYFTACNFSGSQSNVKLMAARANSGIYSVSFANCYANGLLVGSPQVCVSSYGIDISGSAANVLISDIVWNGGYISCCREDGVYINQNGVQSISISPGVWGNIGKWAVRSLSSTMTGALVIGGVMRHVAQNAATSADGGGVYVAGSATTASLTFQGVSVSGRDYGQSINGSPGVSGNLGTGITVASWAGEYDMSGINIRNVAVTQNFAFASTAQVASYGVMPLTLAPANFSTVSAAALGTVGGGRVAAWLLDAATSEAVATTFVVPSWWSNNMRATVLWCNAGAGAGNVVFSLNYVTIAPGNTLNTAGTSTGNFTVTAGLQDVQVNSVAPVSLAVTPGQTLYMRMFRIGGDAADTLANDCGFLGLYLEPL